MLGAGAATALPAHAAQFSRLPARLPPGQFIYRLLGDVRINGIAVTLQTTIQANDVLTTGDKSFVIFVYEADAFILRSNSEMVVRPTADVEQDAPGQTGATAPRKTLPKIAGAYGLRRGKALSVMASRQTNITTPSAVIRVRGTGVYVEAEPDESYVCVCYGATEIESAAAPDVRETVVSKQHDAPKYVTGGASPRIAPAPFKNHDDQELLLIETLVGRTTPYFVPAGASRTRSRYF
jgi:hypothetical protein